MSTAQGICRAINELPLLEELSVKNCPAIDNCVLEKALSTQRTMTFFFGYTKIDPIEFMEKHDNAVKLLRKTQGFQSYECDKLTFVQATRLGGL